MVTSLRARPRCVTRSGGQWGRRVVVVVQAQGRDRNDVIEPGVQAARKGGQGEPFQEGRAPQKAQQHPLQGPPGHHRPCPVLVDKTEKLQRTCIV
ncbi:hypothetical protein NHX12_029133 [Muraenolepis orangiensis]|uniref:Uncharacterized protein n=1 Tax=Muraenolepis orangiensis TaxID=630683 RepID=A0A9Q0IKW5_9TELE|nr:hypothetical protein NHX12_029133 [Muraenolepis orangiensis]